MQVNLGEVDDKEIQSVRISDNLLFGTPLIQVGSNNVKTILYHEPKGEGDRHFIDVTTNDDATTRFFDILSIVFN